MGLDWSCDGSFFNKPNAICDNSFTNNLTGFYGFMDVKLAILCFLKLLNVHN